MREDIPTNLAGPAAVILIAVAVFVWRHEIAAWLGIGGDRG